MSPTERYQKSVEARGDVGKGRGEFNWEMLDLWLGAYAGGYAGNSDEQIGSNPNKSKSQPPINILWMEAIEDPAVRESDQLLTRIVLGRMPYEKPTTFLVFMYLYLREYANPAEAEQWRVGKTQMDKLKWQMLQKGKRWILDEVERMHPGFVLSVPDPIDPKGFVDKSKHAQRVAQRVFYKNIDHKGVREAIRKAAQKSGYSERHVRNLIPKEDRGG